jgi:hypothetical protein
MVWVGKLELQHRGWGGVSLFEFVGPVRESRGGCAKTAPVDKMDLGSIEDLKVEPPDCTRKVLCQKPGGKKKFA